VSDLASAPEPRLRDAKPADAPELAALIRLLGHTVDEKGVRERINLLAADELAPLVATLDKKVVGLCGISLMVAIHRDQPVARISILVVAEDARGQGIGRRLVEAAEARLRELGCAMVEITSNDRLTEAHAFYRAMGYERTSIRFAKTL
jgi:GNAT superfamily N-acetyltransferase